MATYFCDFVNGLDANNGLGPDASHATNKPWKSITKLLGAAGMASGDTAYLSPAGPFREVVTIAMTNPAAETKILGDPGNAQGFKTSGGVRVTPGPVVWTAYTTDDKTAPSASTTLNMASRPFLTFQNIMFVGGTGNTVDVGSVTNVTFRDCAFFGVATAANTVQMTVPFGAAANITFDRCIVTYGTWSGIGITLTTSNSGADYDANILIQNSVFLGSFGNGIYISGSSNLTFRGGGVDIRSILMMGGSVKIANAFTSLTIPCTLTSSFLYEIGNAAVEASALGQITENYNVFTGCVTPRSNVTAGANSKTSYAPLIEIGQQAIFGMFQRPFAEPMANSPLLGFGDDGTTAAYDALNRPRPAGGLSASKGVGPYERGNTWGRETSTVRTGSNAISITGPGYQDMTLPVDTVSTTVAVYMRYDATYAGTKPQVQVRNGEECGVTAATSSAVTTVNTWEQLSLTFTPTSKGIVTIRLLSSDTNGGGKAFADDLTVV